MADFPSRYATKRESPIGVSIAWNLELTGSSVQGKNFNPLEKGSIEVLCKVRIICQLQL